MASALTVLLLGFWLAGQSRVSGEGSYPKPSISISPGGVIPIGGKVTIRCRNQLLGMRFLLYKAGAGNYLTYTDTASSEAEFPITSARREHGGSYTCRYSDRSVRAAYSEPSDPVQIIVAGREFLKPTISVTPSRVVALGGSVTIRCEGWQRSMEFFLHKAGHPNLEVQSVPDGTVAEFPIPSVSREDAGRYTCDYHSITDQSRWSYPSDPVEIIVAGRSAPPGLISPIIAGASAAAAALLLLLLLVLLVAFVCFRKTRARKVAALRQSSTSPMVTLKAPAQQDTIYASVDKGKEPQTLPQDLDPDADGLTYAELDGRVLQAKRGGLAPAPEPAQPSLYAAINVSRGAPQ